MRCLHQCQFLIPQEAANRQLQERAGRHMVAVEQREQIAICLGHGVIKIPCLGMAVVRPCQVAGSACGRELAELIPLAIVQDIDLQFVLGPIHVQGGMHGGRHHAQVLVIRRDEQVDAGPRIGIRRERRRLTAQWPGGLQITQHEHEPRMAFGHHQRDAKAGIQGIIPMQCARISPPEVAAGHDHGQGDQHQRGHAARQTTYHQSQAPQSHNEDEQTVPVQRLSDAPRSERHRQHQPGRSGSAPGDCHAAHCGMRPRCVPQRC